MSLTTPLGLMRHLRRPDMRLEMVPWLNVLLLAWLLSLLGSRFVYAPGMAVDLGVSDGATQTGLKLPQIAGGPLPGRPTSAELTVRTGGQTPSFILGNGIHNLGDLQASLQNTRNQLPKGAPAVLLLKADPNLPLQTFLQVCDMAHAAGFNVQVAAVEAPQNAGETPPAIPTPISLSTTTPTPQGTPGN